MHLLSPMELRELFNQGRFQKQPTLIFATLEHNDGCPVEFNVVDTKMHDLGACWEGDIREVLEEAEDTQSDTAKTNPNLGVFRVALAQMQDFKKSVLAAEEAEHRFTQNKIVPFPSHTNRPS